MHRVPAADARQLNALVRGANPKHAMHRVRGAAYLRHLSASWEQGAAAATTALPGAAGAAAAAVLPVAAAAVTHGLQ
jgi:hypothetical protein